MLIRPSGSDDGSPAAPVPARSPVVGALLLCLGLAVGLALRVGVAWRGEFTSLPWEADGFVRCWESLDFVSANRMRPPLPGWLLHAGAELLGAHSILAVRFLSVGVSLAGLAGALVLGRVLGSRLGHRQPDHAAGARWTVGCWALLPTLFVSAASPLGDSLAGGLVCLTIAAAIRLGGRPGLLNTAWLALALLGAVLAGGIIVASAALVALLVFLVPVPPLRSALPPLLAVLLALAGGWWLQRGPDPERRWMPDAAPAWSLAALTEAALTLSENEPLDPDLRAQAVWKSSLDQARASGALRLLRNTSLRLVGDLLSPARFDHALALDRRQPALGLFDLLLRGGILLFAVAAISMVRPRIESAWPRAGLVTGGVLLFVALLLTATSPFALAPLDLVLLGVAGAGIACADHRVRALRWLAFAVGGVLMVALGVGAMLRGQELSPWITLLNNTQNHGPRIVHALTHAGPPSEAAEVEAAYLLMDRFAPFQRMPEAGLRHALHAAELGPFSEHAAKALVHAYVENLDFDAARDLVSVLRDASGQVTPEARVLSNWVEHSERNWRTAQLRASSTR